MYRNNDTDRQGYTHYFHLSCKLTGLCHWYAGSKILSDFRLMAPAFLFLRCRFLLYLQSADWFSFGLSVWILFTWSAQSRKWDWEDSLQRSWHDRGKIFETVCRSVPGRSWYRKIFVSGTSGSFPVWRRRSSFWSRIQETLPWGEKEKHSVGD